MDINAIRERPVFRTVMLFAVLLTVAVLLIMLGRRNDAVTNAQLYQAGVLSADSVNVSPENIGGKLIERCFEESALVKKGDVLLRLDPVDFTLALEQSRAQAESTRAQIAAYRQSIEIEESRLKTKEHNTWRQIEQQIAAVESAEAALQERSANYSRISRLASSNAVSRSDLDSARAAFVEAQSALSEARKGLESLTIGADVKELEAAVKRHDATGLKLQSIEDDRRNIANMHNTLASYEADLHRLQAVQAQQELNLSRTEIKAPCDGKITSLMFQNGEIIPPNTPAVRLETTLRYFDVYVPENKVSQYKAGDTIKVWAVAQGRAVEGVIRYINPAPSFADLRMTREQGQADLVSYEMRVYVDDPDLITGMSMEIESK